MSQLSSVQPALATRSTSKPQGFRPQRRQRQLLAAVGALSVLLSPFAVGVALAAEPGYSSLPVPTTFASTFVSGLVSAQLTSATFRALVKDLGGAEYDYVATGTSPYSGDDLLAIASSDSLYYSKTTPRYYRFNYCSGSGYFIFGNVLAMSGDLRPEAKEFWLSSDTVQPTPSVTFNLCTQPKVPFTYPSGFVASGSDGNYIFVRSTFPYKLAGTTPANSQNATYAADGLSLVLSRTNAQTAVTIPYTQQGNAVYGTDYTGSSGNGITVTSNSVSLPVGGSGYAPAAVPMSVFFNGNNHPQGNLQFAFTPPTGYTFIGQAVWNGRINAINNSTVSVSPISSTTITPGSTTGGFTLTRLNGDQTQPLTVNYTIGGTAANGSDYGYLSGNATIPAGSSTLNVPIIAPQPSGTTAIPQKDVSISLLAPSNNSYYVPASGATGQSTDFTIPAYNPSTVTFAQGTGGGTLTPGQSQPFTVTRSGGDTSQPLTVNYTTGGTAQSGTDYQPVSGSVTIPAAQTSASVPLSAIQHTGTTAFPATTLSITPAAGTGYDATGAQPISYSIPAYSPSVVSVASPANGGAIAAGGTGTFTVTRTGDTSQALTVPYTTGGTATQGTDYNQLPGSITIPAGATSASQTITTTTPSGSTAVPSKTITLTPTAGNSYTVDSTNGSATYTTAAYTPSGVSFGGATTGMLTPGATTDGFTVTRTGSTTNPLTVNYTVGGSATPGVDYGQLPGSVTIPAGQSSVKVPLRAFPQSGTTAIPQKDVQITLASGSGYAPSSSTPADYTIPAYTPTTGSNPAVTVSIPSGQDTLLTPGTSTDSFQVTRTGATTAPLTVAYTVGGTATSPTDYAPLSGTVTIPAGATSATVPISVPSGATVGKTVAIDLATGTGYSQGTNSNVTYTIARQYVSNSRPALIDLSFDPSIPAFVVTRTGGDTTQPLTVPVDFGGTGVPGVDYSQLPNAVTFGAGKTTAQVPVKLLPTATTGDTITASIPDGSGYTVGSGNGTSFTVPAGYNDGSNVATGTVAPPLPSPKKGSSSGIGATGFIAAAGAVGGTIAASTGALGSGAAAAGAGSALAVPGLLAGSTFGAIPQACSTTGETPIQLAQLLPQLKDSQPNWSSSSFGSLPAPTQDGAVRLGNVSRSWKAGQPVADIVRVGDTDGTFNLHCLGLSKLASLGQMGLAQKPLSTLNLVADTTVQGLSKTLYLRAKKIGDVKGMAEWLAAKSGGKVTAAQLSSLSFADALKATPALAALPMGAMPLAQLPGYSDLLLGDIPNWKAAAVSQIVGLKNVPFSQFPTQPKPLTALNK